MLEAEQNSMPDPLDQRFACVENDKALGSKRPVGPSSASTASCV